VIVSEWCFRRNSFATLFVLGGSSSRRTLQKRADANAKSAASHS
jgi:hypothetical protein